MSEEEKKIARFYKDVDLDDSGEGYVLTLDGRPAKTRGGARLASPNAALGDAIATEWREQGENIDKNAMPLTMLLSAVLDSTEGDHDRWRGEIMNYLKTDLVCYRADGPSKLVKRQTDGWDPFLRWMGGEFGAEPVATTGLSVVDQPTELVEAVDAALGALASPVLFSICTLTTITGSAVISLGAWKNAFSADTAFAASRLDETYQQEIWGVDAEAAAREEKIKREYDAVVSFLRFVDG